MRAKRIGAGVDAHAESGPAKRRKGLLEALDIGPAGKGGVLKSCGDHRQGFGGDRPVLGLEIEEWGFHFFLLEEWGFHFFLLEDWIRFYDFMLDTLDRTGNHEKS